MKLIDVPGLNEKHAAALGWFAERAGQEIGWPEPFQGMFLVNKAKGIHKPAGWDYALSIRKSLNGPYEDELSWSEDGRWQLRYAQEGESTELFTNKALEKCRQDGVPVGVLLQIKPKPNPRYKVLGLGVVAASTGGTFLLIQAGHGLAQAEAAVELSLDPSAFDPTDTTDARQRAMRAIAARRGQPAFRKSLLDAYGGRCAVTGCDFAPVLEAAHIQPYRGKHTNHVCNGLLLRGDVHTLFDLGLIGIDPETYEVRLSSQLAGSDYWSFNGRRIALPADRACWPDKTALAARQVAA